MHTHTHAQTHTHTHDLTRSNFTPLHAPRTSSCPWSPCCPQPLTCSYGPPPPPTQHKKSPHHNNNNKTTHPPTHEGALAVATDAAPAFLRQWEGVGSIIARKMDMERKYIARLEGEGHPPAGVGLREKEGGRGEERGRGDEV